MKRLHLTNSGLLLIAASLFVVIVFESCTQHTESAKKHMETVVSAATDAAHDATNKHLPSDGTVTTAAEQKALTPDIVLQELKSGNERFRANDLTRRNFPEQVKAAAAGQYPKAVVLSCLDSRVPVEDLFDQSIGDLFVGRVAGNFVDEHLLGSMEFGCKVSGAKAIVVMGHQHCGAVKGAIDDVKLGNITTMLAKIKPAVAIAGKDFSGEKTSKNATFVQHAAEENVRYNIEQIRKQSPILKEMEDKGEIKIVGAFYSLETGEVTFMN